MNPNRRLDSWKEIAAYLRCGVRTVQRWERTEGLPVHRHIHRTSGSVYAFTAEIDQWRGLRAAVDRHAVTDRLTSTVPILIGRLSESARLDEHLRRALAGVRQVVFVTGEIGIGKTALVRSFANRVGGEVWMVGGQCVDHAGGGERYLPVIDGLARLVRQPDNRRAVTALARYAPSWLMQIPGCRRGPSIHVEGGNHPSERMAREIDDAFEALGHEKPVLLILEDLQWSDRSTIELVERIARRDVAARILVIGTYRPQELIERGHPLLRIQHELRAQRLCDQIRMPPFSDEEVAAYIVQRRACHTPSPIARHLRQWTGGNPLFIDVVLDQVVGTALTTNDGPVWDVMGSVDTNEWPIPSTLADLIDDRIGRLDPVEQQCLSAASVAGVTFSIAAVATSLRMEAEQVRHVFQSLADRQQWIQRSDNSFSEGEDDTYAFVHALCQRRLYDRLSPPSRASHRRPVADSRPVVHAGVPSNAASAIATEDRVDHWAHRRAVEVIACRPDVAADGERRRRGIQSRARVGRVSRAWRKGVAAVDALSTDVRHSVRALRRSPGFSFVVVMTLALALGANTAIFSLLNAVFLQPMPVAAPDRIVAISATDVQTDDPVFLYADAFTAFRQQQRSFSHLSLYSGGGFLRIEARGASLDAGVEGVMPEYFGLVGARPSVGRLFTDSDQAIEGAAAPVVISDRLWQRMLGRDSQVIGETVKIAGRPMTIVGVTAPGFVGLQADVGSDLFILLSALRPISGDPSLPLRAQHVIGRLAVGMTLDQARSEMLARWPAIQAATLPRSASPREDNSVLAQRITVESLATGFSSLRSQYGKALILLAGAAAILLAIGCINLSSLLLVRGVSRSHQIATCLALGATRGRIIQQVLMDGLILAFGGLSAALPLAWWTSQVLSAMLSFGLSGPPLRPMTPDAHVLAIATLVTVATGLLMTALPARWAINNRLEGNLHARGAAVGSSRQSGRPVLIAQVALSMALVVAAGLFVSTLLRLHDNGRSWTSERILWTRLSRNPDDRRAPLGRSYVEGLVRDLSGIEGVAHAALSFYFPAYLGYAGLLPTAHFTVPAASGSSPPVSGLKEFVTPGFFDTFRIPRLRGRDFLWNDDADAPRVAVITEALRRRLFGDAEAVGRIVRISSGSSLTDVEVVGVVADAAFGNIREPHKPVAFTPILQDLAQAQNPIAHVRVTGNVAGVRDGYIRAVASRRHHYVRQLSTLDDWVDFALLRERLIAGFSTYAATLTVLLACIGIYGSLACAVARRVGEIGVRMALGATRAAIVRMVLKDGVAVAAWGVAIGMPCALAAGRLVRSQLYGIAPSDPGPLIFAAIVFVLTGFVAAFLPAMRASTIDPMDALRHE